MQSIRNANQLHTNVPERIIMQSIRNTVPVTSGLVIQRARSFQSMEKLPLAVITALERASEWICQSCLLLEKFHLKSDSECPSRRLCYGCKVSPSHTVLSCDFPITKYTAYGTCWRCFLDNHHKSVCPSINLNGVALVSIMQQEDYPGLLRKLGLDQATSKVQLLNSIGTSEQMAYSGKVIWKMAAYLVQLTS